MQRGHMYGYLFTMGDLENALAAKWPGLGMRKNKEIPRRPLTTAIQSLIWFGKHKKMMNL